LLHFDEADEKGDLGWLARRLLKRKSRILVLPKLIVAVRRKIDVEAG
jgi:hypothetical protein